MKNLVKFSIEKIRYLHVKSLFHSTRFYCTSNVNSLNQQTRTLIDTNDPEFAKSVRIEDNFVTDQEERSLLNEIEPYIKRLRYEFEHWDDAIHGYRESERQNWNEENKKILDRVKKIAFPIDSSTQTNSNLLAHIHILDIHKDGYIKPHVDSIRFCGTTIAGLSLLSDSIMRFKNVKNNELYANLLLKRRSLYIISNYARYDFTHEILKNSESYFLNEHIPRDRRVSVICRNRPTEISQNS